MAKEKYRRWTSGAYDALVSKLKELQNESDQWNLNLATTQQALLGAINAIKPLVIEMDGTEENPKIRNFSTSEIADIEEAMEIGRVIVFHFKGDSNETMKFPHMRIVDSAYKIKTLLKLEYISYKSWRNPATQIYTIQVSTAGDPGMVVTTSIFSNPGDGDGITYGIKNGQYEKIANKGEGVLTYSEDTAYSLAIQALKTGQIPVTDKPELLPEVEELLGEELWSEIGTKAIATLEHKIEETEEQQLLKAKAEYQVRKEKTAQREAEIAEAMEKMSTDVEQSKLK